jgi:alpha,alpha-trehalose phosphorylase
LLHREIVGLPTTLYPVDEWALIETAFEDEYLQRAETIFSVANGYVGLRGCPDEGRPYHDRGTFINGFHEIWPIEHAEEAYGFAKVGQTIVPVPDARRFHLYVDDEPLHLPSADLESYERRLDFKRGVLDRDVLWRTPAGKLVRVRSRRFVSMEHRHLVGIRYEVTLLEGSAPIIVSSQLRHELDGGEGSPSHFDPRKSRGLGDVLRPVAQHCRDRRVVMRYQVAESGMTLACAIDHEVEVNAEYTDHCEADTERGKYVVSVDATPGTTIRIDKYAAYFTSRSVSTAQLADRCERTLDRALANGWDANLAAQEAYFADFWDRSDVEVAGNPVVQQAVRWNLFQLIQAAGRAEGAGIPAKGLTGSGYEGHYFWDTEIYVLPFLTYTHPIAARNLLRFRHGMLDAARRRAVEVNQRGALFPWRTINGEEASAYYEAGTAQYHINADIVYALKKYVDATGDRDFLARYGAPILVETARLWEDLGFFRNGNEGSFHIHGVTGPDEYTTLVNDNAFTNLMARLNLRYAADVVDDLAAGDPEVFARLAHDTAVGPDEPALWRRAADAMYIPYDEDRGITPQDANFLAKEVWDFDHTPREKYPLLLHFHPLVIYRFQVLKQADIVMAMFLLPDEFDADLKRRNFDYYDPLTTGDSSLSASVEAVVAAELAIHARASEYFRHSLFMDLADIAGNVADGVHVAAAGGVWLALVSGFGGMRDTDGRVSFWPRLPSGWDGLKFAVAVRGSRVRVAITRFQVVYTLEDGPPVTIEHRGEKLDLEAGVGVTRSMVVPGL